MAGDKGWKRDIEKATAREQTGGSGNRSGGYILVLVDSGEVGGAIKCRRTKLAIFELTKRPLKFLAALLPRYCNMNFSSYYTLCIINKYTITI